MHDEWVGKAFELAYFIHGDRTAAIGIATEALSKLETAASAQFKRLYYSPKGRSGSSGARTKVSLGDLHLLQRLIYIESEPHEHRREGSGDVTDHDMIRHFIKHLVRITMKRNSFYVTLGLARLLHNYSTAETADIFGVVAQDPDRARDEDYYRSRKRRLLEEIRHRFAERIRISRRIRGEERFEAVPKPQSFSSLVYRCLETFTPWNTQCAIPAAFEPFRHSLPSLRFTGSGPDEEHTIEINRMHSILHPQCFRRIVQGLRIDPPEQRLELPLFAMANGHGNGRGSRDDEPEPLSSDEIQAIREHVNERARLRKTTAAGLLIVLVDGVEHARLEACRSSKVSFEVQKDAELVEIRSLESSDKILLATHLLNLDPDQAGLEPSSVSIVLEGGQKLTLVVHVRRDPSGEPAGASISLEYQETLMPRALSLKLQRLRSSIRRPSTGMNAWLRPALALLVAAVLVSVFVFFPFSPAPDLRPPEQSADRENVSPPPTAPPSPLPEIARNLPPTPDPDLTRSVKPELPDVRLADVENVYVDDLGPAFPATQVRDELLRILEAGARFNVSVNPDQADAVFRGSVEGVGDDRVVLRLRLINPRGETLWSAIERGPATQVAKQALAKLR